MSEYAHQGVTAPKKDCTTCRYFVKKRELCSHPNVYELRARYGNGPLSVDIMREDKPAICGPRGEWWQLTERTGGPQAGKLWAWIGALLLFGIVLNMVLLHVRAK